jgi:hypothetical protein
MPSRLPLPVSLRMQGHSYSFGVSSLVITSQSLARRCCGVRTATRASVAAENETQAPCLFAEQWDTAIATAHRERVGANVVPSCSYYDLELAIGRQRDLSARQPEWGELELSEPNALASEIVARNERVACVGWPCRAELEGIIISAQHVEGIVRYDEALCAEITLPKSAFDFVDHRFPRRFTAPATEQVQVHVEVRDGEAE